MAILTPQTTTTTPTRSKNTNAVYYDPAAQDQFTAAAQARNPTYQPDTNSFDINKYMFDQGTEYGWQDPLAADIFNEYAGKNPYTTKSSDYWLDRALPFEGSGTEASYKSPLDPRNWGRTFQGDVMDEMAAEYEKRATAAAVPTVPAGPGESDPAAYSAGGSIFSVAPDVGGDEELAKKLSGMWIPQPIK